MSSKKLSQEEINKLAQDAEKAYIALCQIIATAIEGNYQTPNDFQNAITQWQTEFKETLDLVLYSDIHNAKISAIKKKIQLLLSENYQSEILEQILSIIRQKIKSKEKKIANQRKALTELRSIIQETNDLDSLRNKVSDWEKKYPISSFLDMYARIISSCIRETNLKKNAFDQKTAFDELVQISIKHGTFDELKKIVSDWETKYNIGENNKFKIESFKEIGKESEAKRYTSDEYLFSISTQSNSEDARSVISSVDNNSSLATQAAAYSSLMSIAIKPNNIDEIFDWVYKNNSIKFNDSYKERILAATALEYSPRFLNKLHMPNINLTAADLSLDEYNNMDSIKRYAVISYFNLLLPSNERIPNDYFKKHVREIYHRSEELKHTNKIITSTDELISSGTEIPLSMPKVESLDTEKSTVKVTGQAQVTPEHSHTEKATVDTSHEIKDNPESSDTKELPVEAEIIPEPSHTENVTIDISDKTQHNPESSGTKEVPVEAEVIPESSHTEDITTEITDKTEIIPEETKKTVIDNKSSLDYSISHDIDIPDFSPAKDSVDRTSDDSTALPVHNTEEPDLSDDNIDVVMLSPLFFEAIHNHAIRAKNIKKIDRFATEGIKHARDYTPFNKTKI